MDKQTFGKRIKEARIAAGYTQECLAEKVGISTIFLSELERGIKFPSLPLFAQLAAVLNISADALLRDELESGKAYVYNDVTNMLDQLTPQQRRGAVELLETYIRICKSK